MTDFKFEGLIVGVFAALAPQYFYKNGFTIAPTIYLLGLRLVVRCVFSNTPAAR
jgi:hypothetical protein